MKTYRFHCVSLWRECIIVGSDILTSQTSRGTICSSMSVMSCWRSTASRRNCESGTTSRTEILYTYLYLYSSEHAGPTSVDWWWGKQVSCPMGAAQPLEHRHANPCVFRDFQVTQSLKLEGTWIGPSL